MSLKIGGETVVFYGAIKMLLFSYESLLCDAFFRHQSHCNWTVSACSII